MEKLKKQDPNFAEMVERHKSLESKLEELRSKSYLSAEDEALERALKREKLHLRDQIDKIIRINKNVVLPA